MVGVIVDEDPQTTTFKLKNIILKQTGNPGYPRVPTAPWNRQHPSHPFFKLMF